MAQQLTLCVSLSPLAEHEQSVKTITHSNHGSFIGLKDRWLNVALQSFATTSPLNRERPPSVFFIALLLSFSTALPACLFSRHVSHVAVFLLRRVSALLSPFGVEVRYLKHLRCFILRISPFGGAPLVGAKQGARQLCTLEGLLCPA